MEAPVWIPPGVLQYLRTGRWRSMFTEVKIEGLREYGIVFVPRDVPPPDTPTVFRSQKIDTDYGSLLRFHVTIDYDEDRKCSVEVWINPMDDLHRSLVESMLSNGRVYIICLDRALYVRWYKKIELPEEQREKIRDQLRKAIDRNTREGFDFEDALVEAMKITSPIV